MPQDIMVGGAFSYDSTISTQYRQDDYGIAEYEEFPFTDGISGVNFH
jgi:hypothetical protein